MMQHFNRYIGESQLLVNSLWIPEQSFMKSPRIQTHSYTSKRVDDLKAPKCRMSKQ